MIYSEIFHEPKVSKISRGISCATIVISYLLILTMAAMVTYMLNLL